MLEAELTADEIERIRLHVEILIDGYDKAISRVSDLELELASIKFDRDCLSVERQQLQDQLRNQPGGMTDASVEDLVNRLIDAGIPRDQKLSATKFIKKCTGWPLMESKRWVEANYYWE